MPTCALSCESGRFGNGASHSAPHGSSHRGAHVVAERLHVLGNLLRLQPCKGVSPVPVRIWEGRARSRWCRCAGVSPVPVFGTAKPSPLGDDVPLARSWLEVVRLGSTQCAQHGTARHGGAARHRMRTVAAVTLHPHAQPPTRRIERVALLTLREAFRVVCAYRACCRSGCTAPSRTRLA